MYIQDTNGNLLAFRNLPVKTYTDYITEHNILINNVPNTLVVFITILLIPPREAEADFSMPKSKSTIFRSLILSFTPSKRGSIQVCFCPMEMI